MRRVQVQTAQSCSDGELRGNKGILLQGHSVRPWPPCSRECSFSVGEEKRNGALPETSVHEEGRTLHPRTVTPIYRTIFMKLRKLPWLPVCLLLGNVLPFSMCLSVWKCFPHTHIMDFEGTVHLKIQISYFSSWLWCR